ncbi:MAG: TrbI/VirB10 family protein [Deltaproteobacteria bacterium]|nr:TrbI/VirB10 family protein [Deltaproteobacteria bacterium]
MKWKFGISLIFATTAGASDFNADVQRINSQGDKIEERVRVLGFKLKGHTEKADSDEPKKRQRLYQVHADDLPLRSVAGRVLSGQTANRLIVGPEGSPAIVTMDDGQGLFSGLRILGQAKQGSSEGRLFIDFDRLIFRSGKVLPIKGTALDDVGGYGLKAQVVSSKALMIAGSIAGSFISGYAASQQSTSQSAFGFSQSQAGSRNGILQGVAQTAADQSKKFIEDATKEKPILVVEPDTKVSLYLDEEVRF